ncbi:MAG: NAD(P)H-hydrate epimerase, partial [Bacteroidales bacterium]|nr:NAD(P)H-hydrate epimerase [Bacteroidales bacterium]
MLTKIFPVDKIREADAFTIENEPINSLDLMERAAKECFIWLAKKANFKQSFTVFCGPGNNGGDGLAIARMLVKAKHPVKVYILNVNDKYSSDFKANLERLQNLESCAIHYLSLGAFVDFDINPDAIIIDAIFGSGLNKSLKGFPKQIIKMLNQLPNIKVSIDIPSGLFADHSSIGHGVEIFSTDYTLSFQFPKLAFLFPENEMYIGEWHVLDIGLSDEYIVNTETSEFFISLPLVKRLIKPRSKFSHKGHFGHLLIIAGDHTKMG